MQQLIYKLFQRSIKIQNTLSNNLYLLELNDGLKLIYKCSKCAKIEALMLNELNRYIDCAKVYYSDEEKLIMQYLPFHGAFSDDEFAKKLALMHQNRFEYFGFEYDTTIGPFTQQNTKTDSWPKFFAKQRIEYMAKYCLNENKIDQRFFERLQKLCSNISNYLPQTYPTILHGDIWGGNVMNDGQKTVLIDPAIYYGSNEYDIAFSTMFSTFSKRFYDIYSSYNTLDKDFWKVRKDILNIYPLLVHLRSFGTSYKMQLEGVLLKLGY